MHKFELELAWTHNGTERSVSYEYEAANFYVFRHEFLKRFGNRHFPHRLEEQKKVAKELAYIATNAKQMLGFINTNTDFKIRIVKYNDKPVN